MRKVNISPFHCVFMSGIVTVGILPSKWDFSSRLSLWTHRPWGDFHFDKVKMGNINIKCLRFRSAGFDFQKPCRFWRSARDGRRQSWRMAIHRLFSSRIMFFTVATQKARKQKKDKHQMNERCFISHFLIPHCHLRKKIPRNKFLSHRAESLFSHSL